MQHREPTQHDGQRHQVSHAHDPGVVIEACKQGTACRESQGEEEAARQIDPEQIAGKPVTYALALHHRFGQPVDSKIHEQHAEGSNHGHQPKVAGRKDAGEHIDG